MTDVGKQSIRNWIEGSTMFDEYARKYVMNLIDRDRPKEIREVVRKLEGRDYEMVSYLCTSCNYNVDLGDKFCKNCGQKLKFK